MHRTNRNNAVCFASLEQALAKRPEAYRHIDVLCGGWPCQDNSIAGNRAGHKGKKSGLWKEYRRLVELFMPRWVIAENVPGLFSVNHGADFWQVVSDLDTLGYCVAWRVLDSQFFGVAQRRRRVFIVGSLGNIGAGKVLFEQEGGRRNLAALKKEKQPRGLCLSTRDGERQDPSTENLICSTIRAHDDSCGHRGFERSNLVSYTLNTGKRGSTGTLWEETGIASPNSNRKRTSAGFPYELVAPRGVVIGNAVTVSVAEWVGRRIIQYERGMN